MIAESQQSGFTSRPAFAVLISLVCGIGFSSVYPNVGLETAPLALTIGVLLFVSVFASRWSVLRLPLCVLISVLLGYALGTSQTASKRNSIITKYSHRAYRNCTIYGVVRKSIGHSAYSNQFRVDLDSLSTDSLTIVDHRPILLRVGNSNPLSRGILPERGDRVHAYADLDDIYAIGNPYQRLRYTTTLRNADAEALAHVASPFDLYITDSSDRRATIIDRVRDIFDTIHTNIAARLGRLIDDSVTRAIVLAVVLGDKVDIPPQTSLAFRSAGMAHILVVSGFNVGIVAILIYYLLRLIGIARLRWRIALSMIAVAAYALIIGLEPSVVRALALIEFVFAAQLLERKPDYINITAATAAVALIFDPSLLFDGGFLLTYGAVFSILLITPRLSMLIIPQAMTKDHSLWGRTKLNMLRTFISSLSVTLGLLPIMLWYFQRVTLTGVLSNIIGIPLAGVLTSLSFLLIPLSYISSTLAGIYGEVTSILARALNMLATVSSSMTWSSPLIARPGLIVVMCYGIAIAYIVRSESTRRMIGRIIVVCSFIFLLLTLHISYASPLFARSGILSVIFCDVGQGDAMLIHTPHGKTYAIDLGGVDRNAIPIADRTIVPILDAEAIPIISKVFITHMHIDHYGGALNLAETDRIASFGTSGERAVSREAFMLDSVCRSNHIAVTRLQRGMSLRLDSGVILYVLNPDSAVSVRATDMNHHSLVLKLVYGKTSMLLLGDIDASDELGLAHRYGSFLHCDVVKVAHHGSQYSSDIDFTSLVQPHDAVVSVGEYNRFGHPSRNALSAWRAAGAIVHRTDRDGALLFRSDGMRVWHSDWQNSTPY